MKELPESLTVKNIGYNGLMLIVGLAKDKEEQYIMLLKLQNLQLCLQ